MCSPQYRCEKFDKLSYKVLKSQINAQKTKMFLVDRHPLQRGRGLGGLFANLFRKVIPFGKSFARGALSAGKRFAQSDVGKEIINDTLQSTARAATSAIIDNDPNAAKEELVKSLKRTKKKSGEVAKKIAKEELEKVLSGKGKRTVQRKKKRRKKIKTIFE